MISRRTLEDIVKQFSKRFVISTLGLKPKRLEVWLTGDDFPDAKARKGLHVLRSAQVHLAGDALMWFKTTDKTLGTTPTSALLSGRLEDVRRAIARERRVATERVKP